MSVKFQISDRRGEAILLVSAEGPGEQSDQVYAGFAAAVQSAGLDGALDGFGNLAADPLAAARQTVANAGMLAAQQQPWGNPPVPAYQPPPLPAAAAPQQGAAPVCQHGTKVHRSGTNSRGEWNAWACPAPKGDPTQCKFDFIR